MRMKRLAAAILAGLTLLGAAPAASARHKAEEYMEAVQREKAERARERERAVRQRPTVRRQSDTRRTSPPPSSQDGATADAWEDEARDGQDAASEAARAAEKPETDATARAAREAAAPEAREAAATGEERKAPKDTATDEMVDWHRREGDEARKKEEPRDDEAKGTEAPPRIDFPQNGVRESDDRPSAERQASVPLAAKEEGALAKYLRRARERAAGDAPPQNAPPTETGANILRVVQPESMKALAVDKTDTGGTLIFSDSPEYVKEPGILYSDVVKGDVRVFYYHLNDTKKPYKVAVVLENDSGQFSILRITRSAMAAPSDNYFAVGRGLQSIYFGDGQRPDKLYIASGEKRLLSEAMDKTILKPGELIAGAFDFSASAPLRVSVLFYPAREDPLRFIEEAKVLPNDEHRLRGTFIGTDRVIRARRAYRPDRDGIRYVVICDGQKDAFLKGVDATDGRLAENVGNYGVVYRLEIPVAGGEDARVFMSPMGGSFSGIVRAEEKKTPGFRLFDVPEGALCFGEHSIHPETVKDGSAHLMPSGELAALGTYHGKTAAFFEMSPPGASNLPVLLILAPDDLKLQKSLPVPEPKDTPKETKAK